MSRGAHLVAAMLSLVACTASGQPQHSQRLAYVTVLSAEDAQERLAPVKLAVDRLWRDKHGEPPDFTWATFTYGIPPPRPQGPPTQPEVDADKALAAVNERELQRLEAWKPDLVYAPGASAADAVEKRPRMKGTPVIVGCKCNAGPKGSWKLSGSGRMPNRGITGFGRLFMDEDDEREANKARGQKPGQDVLHAAEVDNRGPAFTSLHARRLDYLRRLAGKKPEEWMAVLVLYGEEYDRHRWDYRAMAREKNVEWVEFFMSSWTIDALPAIFRQATVKEGPHKGQPIEAGLVLADTFLDMNTKRLATAAAQVPIPVMFPWDEARDGALLHFGTKMDVPAKSAEYIVNVLSGKKIPDYPIEGPKRYELGVNRETFARWARPVPQYLRDDPDYKSYPSTR